MTVRPLTILPRRVKPLLRRIRVRLRIHAFHFEPSELPGTGSIQQLIVVGDIGFVCAELPLFGEGFAQPVMAVGEDESADVFVVFVGHLVQDLVVDVAAQGFVVLVVARGALLEVAQGVGVVAGFQFGGGLA